MPSSRAEVAPVLIEFPEEVFTVPSATGSRITGTLAETGTGPLVVFLHGLVGLNEHWEDVVRRVRHRCRCAMVQFPLLSLRGSDCSIDGVSDMTIRFLVERYRQPAILVGNSFGGHVALRVALQRPDLVKGLVLAGSSGLIEKSMVSDVQIRPSREWLVRKVGELFFDPDRYMRDADIDRAHKELSDRGGARAMVRLSRSARRNHLGDDMARIEAPTLLIWGRNDVVTPPEAALGFLERLRNSRIVWFDECGHAPMIERPAEFADAMLAFVEELGPAGPEA